MKLIADEIVDLAVAVLGSVIAAAFAAVLGIVVAGGASNQPTWSMSDMAIYRQLTCSRAAYQNNPGNCDLTSMTAVKINSRI